MKRRFFWRTRHRGLFGTSKQSLFFTQRFIKNSTLPKLLNFGLAKTAKFLRHDRLHSMPYRYTIDPINVCNLRCPLCPTGLGILGRDRGKMDLADFQRLVDQVAPYAYLVELYNWGEPFLHPAIFDIISYAHERRIAVRISSNLNHFSPELARRTVASGLDAVTVSIDGVTEESYQQYRRRGKLDKVLANLRSLIDARADAHADHPFILARMLVNRYNENEIDALRNHVMDMGVDVFAAADIFVDTSQIEQRREWLPSNAINSVYEYQDAAQNAEEELENVWHCADLWESMTINWDGGTAPCCWLHDAHNDFANALESPIRQIWNGDAYISARRTFAFGGPKPGPRQVICNECRGRPRYLKM